MPRFDPRFSDQLNRPVAQANPVQDFLNRKIEREKLDANLQFQAAQVKQMEDNQKRQKMEAAVKMLEGSLAQGGSPVASAGNSKPPNIDAVIAASGLDGTPQERAMLGIARDRVETGIKAQKQGAQLQDTNIDAKRRVRAGEPPEVARKRAQDFIGFLGGPRGRAGPEFAPKDAFPSLQFRESVDDQGNPSVVGLDPQSGQSTPTGVLPAQDLSEFAELDRRVSLGTATPGERARHRKLSTRSPVQAMSMTVDPDTGEVRFAQGPAGAVFDPKPAQQKKITEIRDIDIGIGHINTLIEAAKNPNASSARGSLAQAAGNILGVGGSLTGLDDESAATMLLGTFQGQIATDASNGRADPELLTQLDFNTRGSGFLGRGTRTVLGVSDVSETILAYNLARAARRGRISKQDIETFRGVVGIRGFKDPVQTQARLNSIKNDMLKKKRGLEADLKSTGVTFQSSDGGGGGASGGGSVEILSVKKVSP